ncbi:hypothetical protein HCN44_005433 [Aphidius gifuensis]|uniref:Ionotropic receptor n=1 Tax=Aphidius gifuensis TaxID=684658 RepID=A0A834Y631_APHGI|nr:hypothetical protein HCN44_005433 [Aphidius gifuensis]
MLGNKSLTCLIFLKFLLFVTGDHYDLQRGTWFDTNKNQENFTIDLINECFTDTRTIIMVSENKKMSISFKNLISFNSRIIITGLNSSEVSRNENIYIEFPNLLLITSTLENLYELLINLKEDFTLWDVDRPTILLNGNSSDTDCNTAENYLLTAWEAELLHVIYLCIDSDNEKKLFAYNPYDSSAPKPWKLNKILPGFYNHSWSLFEQSLKFVKNKKNYKNTCNNLFFDQTQNFGKYPVKLSYYINEPYVSAKNIGNEIQLSGLNTRPNLLALSRMNVTIVKNEIPRKSLTEKLHNHDSIIFSNNLSSYQDRWDVISNILSIYDKKDIRPTRLCSPILYTTISKKKYLTSFELLEQSPLKLYILFLLFGLIINYFYYLKFKNIIDFIDIFRIILGLALIKLPKNISTKIIIFSLIGFFFIMNNIYPGDLMSSITVLKTQMNIEQISDINDFNYNLSVRLKLFKILNFDNIKNLHIDTNKSRECYTELKKNNDACLTGQMFIKSVLESSESLANNYHLPKKALYSVTRCYQYRRHWPASRQFNNIHSSIMESGIYEHWTINNQINLTLIKGNDKTKKMKINLENVKPAFFILLIGFLLSIIVFIIELNTMNKRKKFRYKKNREIIKKKIFVMNNIRDNRKYKNNQLPGPFEFIL